MFSVPEQFRLTSGEMGSNKEFGNNGVFIVRSIKFKRPFSVIASDGAGWEHVSVSLSGRDPTWNEMCFIKGLFWGEGDVVFQLHPAKDQYVNFHKHCLHLWRNPNQNPPLPHTALIGPK